MGDLLDAVDLNIGQAVAAKIPSIRSRVNRSSLVKSASRGLLYFDLETIPDYSRFEQFGLDPIPEPAKRASLTECVHGPVKFLDATVEGFKANLLKLNPCDEYLDQLEAAEKAAPKPRKGILDAIADVRNQDAARLVLVEQQRKEMSISPEMNRIVALGWGYIDCPTRSLVVGEKTPESDAANPVLIDERYILETFWQLAAAASSVIGFNILGFDLPTLFIRSALLDVKPSRLLDLKPWGKDCVDLMAVRFPKSQAKKLKWLAAAMGVEVPAGDVDGSQVEELWRTDKAKVGEYVRSDVEISRDLHRAYRGFFC